MTRRLGGLRLGVLSGTTGIVVAAGMVFGASGVTHADPSTDPSVAATATTTPTSAAPAAAPVTTPKVVATAAPKPTMAAEGGAAAGVAAGAAAGTTAATAASTGDVLDQLADEYATGAGGGQLSNLLKVALKLKAMGFKPSKQYNQELSTAMKYRPNQLPLIDALKDTIAYQQKLKAQMDVLSNAQARQGAAMGAGAAPGPSNPGYGGGPVSVVATPPAAPPPTP